MAASSNIPRDIQESIREVLDKRVKVAIKRLVSMVTKGEKTENKVLAFSACRLYVLAARVPSKIDHSIHYLDVQSIESKKPNQLALTFSSKGGSSVTLNFLTLEQQTEEVDHMITHIGVALKAIFPASSLEKIIKKIDVNPPERLKTMYDMMKDIEAREPGPCGGYSHMYSCMCNYHELPFRDEVAWDVDTIYLSQDTKELSLADFDHLESKDLIPIISALEHNTWFTKLNASNVRLIPDAQHEILKVMMKNSTIEELYLSGIGVKWEFANKLATAVISNTNTPLTTIDLSNNNLEDRGVIHLCGPVSKLNKGLVHLNLSRTGITTKGVNKLADALTQNKNITSSLQTLSLADNVLRGEDVTNLLNFLAQPNAITHLDLSGTEIALDAVFTVLLRGCTQKLTHLNLSKNIYSTKKSKDTNIPQTWKQFFASAIALKHLNLSDCKLPSDTLKPLLLGIGSNIHVKELELDLSSNDLRTPGAHVIESCIAEIPNITSLDISDNGFDLDIKSIVGWISRNRAIKHLSIGRNFNNIKPKNMIQVLEAVVQMIQEEESPLTSLSLAKSRLGAFTGIIINGLNCNDTIEFVDISGNQMGDFGARMLAKALQINTKLKTIYWDKNMTTAKGFEDIAAALEKNHSVRKMPTPIHDAASALTKHPERTQKALERIEMLLHRNHSPRKFASDQAFRLQQGFLISSTQQMVDRLVVHLQDTVNALNISPDQSFKNDVEKAEKFIADADNSKQLLPKLQGVALASEQEEGNTVEMKLRTIAEDLTSVLERQMKTNVSDMLSCAKEQCPGVMEEESITAELEQGCSERSVFPKDFGNVLIVDQVGTDVMNKISELNLAVAAYISDRIVDQVIESLSSTQKTLTNHLNTRKSLQRAPVSVKKEDSQEEKKEEFTIEKDGKEKPGDSPKVKNKRQSLYLRKQRPQSVIDFNDVDQPDSKPTRGSAPILEELDIPPVTQVQKLEHVTKSRPKRAKTRAATRPTAPPNIIIEDETNIEVDDFFENKPVAKEHKPAPPAPVKTPEKVEDTKPVKAERKKHWFGSNKEKDSGKEKEKEKEKEKKENKFSGFKHSLGNLLKGSNKSPEQNKKDKDVVDAKPEPAPAPVTNAAPAVSPKQGSIRGGSDIIRGSPARSSGQEEKRPPVAENETKPVEKENVEEKEEKKEEAEDVGAPVPEAEEAPKEVAPKKPLMPKFGMGFGGGLLAEMRQKRESMVVGGGKPGDDKSKQKPVAKPPVATVKEEPSTKTEPKTDDKDKRDSSPRPASVIKPAAPPADTKPKPNVRPKPPPKIAPKPKPRPASFTKPRISDPKLIETTDLKLTETEPKPAETEPKASETDPKPTETEPTQIKIEPKPADIEHMPAEKDVKPAMDNRKSTDVDQLEDKDSIEKEKPMSTESKEIVDVEKDEVKPTLIKSSSLHTTSVTPAPVAPARKSRSMLVTKETQAKVKQETSLTTEVSDEKKIDEGKIIEKQTNDFNKNRTSNVLEIKEELKRNSKEIDPMRESVEEKKSDAKQENVSSKEARLESTPSSSSRDSKPESSPSSLNMDDFEFIDDEEEVVMV